MSPLAVISSPEVFVESAPLQFSVATSFESAGLSSSAWDEFVQSVGSDLYFSYDWCRLWWEHYGRGRALQILVFRRGAEIVAILPIAVSRIGLGPLSVRVAKFVGADSTIVVLHPAIREEDARSVYQSLIQHVFENAGCDLFYLGPLSGERPHLRQAIEACESLPDTVRVLRAGQIGVHTLLSLPSTMEEYLGGLSGNARGNYRRTLRNLQKEADVRFEELPAEQAVEAFEAFVTIHATQWRQEGKLGHFGDWPGALEFNRALVRDFASRGRVRLDRIQAGGETVQMEYSILFGDSVHWRLPARAVDERWERLGVGRVSLVQQFEWAMRDGYRRFEAGPGHYDYKLKLGAVERPLESAVMASNRLVSRVRAGGLTSASKLLNLLYYRIWYQRIAPKLPIPRRSLWRSWIQTRFQ